MCSSGKGRLKKIRIAFGIDLNTKPYSPGSLFSIVSGP